MKQPSFAELMLHSSAAHLAARLIWELDLSVADDQIISASHSFEDVTTASCSGLWAFLASLPPGHLFSVEGENAVMVVNNLYNALAAQYGDRVRVIRKWETVNDVPRLVIGYNLSKWPRFES